MEPNESIPDWSTAPHAIRERIRIAGEDTVLENTNGLRTSVRAIGELSAVRQATREGYGYEPSTPCTTELERLIHEEPSQAGRFRARNSLELQFEREARRVASNAAIVILGARRRAAAEVAERQAAQRQTAIDARTAELVAEQRTKTETKLRAQAEKELA